MKGGDKKVSKGRHAKKAALNDSLIDIIKPLLKAMVKAAFGACVAQVVKYFLSH